MAKISVESIREELNQIDWKLLSENYQNLEQELEFECPEGHKVYSNWKKMRTKPFCPVCEQNLYKKNNTPVLRKSAKARRGLALDQASHITGYALFEDRKLLKWGVFQVKSESEDQRIHEVDEWLQSKIYDWDIDIVGIEGIQYQETYGVTTFQTLARLQGVLINTCLSNKVDYRVCSTNTWRHHCGVKGRTRADKKKSMQLLIKEWFDITVTDDVADAIGIGKYLTDTYVPVAKLLEWD